MSARVRNGLVLGLAAAKLVAAGEEPGMPVLPGTSTQCVYWHDNNGFLTCDQVVSLNYITVEQFRQYNPSIGAGCTNLQSGYSYCVEINPKLPIGGVTTTSSTSSSTSTASTSSTKSSPTTLTTITTSKTSSTSSSSSTSTTTTPTPTKPGNGITTPTPTQPGMVSNCDAFHFVKPGSTCNDVLTANSITLAQLYQWNPSVGSTCSGLWADVYVCVSTTDHTPTPVEPGNGIATPSPLQREIVTNCDAFYMVKPDETCDIVASKNGITAAQLAQWNPSVGTNCAGLWANAYACVSIIGHTPTPVNPGNGIQTPSPIQDGMTKSCKTFHFVSGQTCQSVLDRYKISLADFYKWNPAVGNVCQSMWDKTHLSAECPKFDNYSLPAPPAIKDRGLDRDTLTVSNQTDVILHPKLAHWNDVRRPDIWQSEGCTSWTLQMPAAFGFLGSSLPPLERVTDFQFELACASTGLVKQEYSIAGGSFNTTEDPYLSRAQCRVHSMFWTTWMGLITAPALVPSLIPEGKKLDLYKARKIQAIQFVFLLYLHVRFCTSSDAENSLNARLGSLLSRYDESGILRQIFRAGVLTFLLPSLWQFAVAFRNSRPLTRHCKLGYHFWSAVARFENELVAGPWSFLPTTPTEIYVRKVLYVSMFPFLGMFLTWPVDELMLNGPWSPVPFAFLALLYNRDSGDAIDELEYWQWWGESAQGKRLSDGPGDNGVRALGCERCDEDRLVLAS
ncbi:hypothetical protein OQA88_10219 [Cercophora sp. LCS_1]